MQSSDTATGVRMQCWYHIFMQSEVETNKQVLICKFGEDLSYFVILRYKLRDFIKIYGWPKKRGFSEDFVTILDRQEKFRGI